MQHRIVSLGVPFVVGIIALALGWFAHAAVPLAAEGILVEGRATRSDPAAPAAPANTFGRLTYQGRLTNRSGAPINSTVNMTFRIYTDTPNIAIWMSATRIITPVNGLFTVYLGDDITDPTLGTTVLSQAASIGVTVGGDAEMTPRQALNTIVGHSITSAGVVGSSDSWNGVRGTSNSSVGVLGSSNSFVGVYGDGGSGTGVYGVSAFGVGVYGEGTAGSGVLGTSNLAAGVTGHSNIHAGVYGTSNYTSGVFGFSTSGTGVYAASDSGNGVFGSTGVISRAGILAQNSMSGGPALEIANGGIKVDHAGGIGSNTFAFVHQSSVTNTAANFTRIDNALTNGDPNAMLFVTHVNNPAGVSSNSFNVAFGVYYDAGSSEWTIYREDSAAMPPDATFNVMVIKR